MEPGDQRLQVLGRAIELGQFDVEARLGEHAAALGQQQVGNATGREVADLEQLAARLCLGPRRFRQQAGAGGAQRQHRAAAGREETAPAHVRIARPVMAVIVMMFRRRDGVGGVLVVVLDALYHGMLLSGSGGDRHYGNRKRELGERSVS